MYNILEGGREDVEASAKVIAPPVIGLGSWLSSFQETLIEECGHYNDI